MQKIAKRKPFRNSELPNIFDVPFRSPLYPPFPPPEPKPTSPAELARILLQGQTENNAKPGPEKSGARK
jgi:hypothetical protein